MLLVHQELILVKHNRIALNNTLSQDNIIFQLTLIEKNKNVTSQY